MNERVYLIRKTLKLTQKEFANRIGITTSTLCDIEKGRCPVTKRTINSICYEFGVLEEWLRTGKGYMISTLQQKLNELNDEDYKKVCNYIYNLTLS